MKNGYQTLSSILQRMDDGYEAAKQRADAYATLPPIIAKLWSEMTLREQRRMLRSWYPHAVHEWGKKAEKIVSGDSQSLNILPRRTIRSRTNPAYEKMLDDAMDKLSGLSVNGLSLVLRSSPNGMRELINEMEKRKFTKRFTFGSTERKP